ncbi:MAG: lipopolysaccharide biosynthesis protein RfbH, partial [Paucibacter sp.]|nr:lipopolysaccharide biosynthesis protein RfbH [Roseateles sp.]
MTTTSPIQFTPKSPDAIRREIAALVQQYADIAYAPRPFVPGETPVP